MGQLQTQPVTRLDTTTTPAMMKLRQLLRMQSPSNVGGMGRERELDVASGMDAFEPSEGELKQAQVEGAQTSGPYTVYRSRDDIRGDAMQALRRQLGMGEIAHRQKVEEELAPVQMKGQFDVQAQREAARVTEDRRAANEQAAEVRQQRMLDAQSDRLDRTLAAQGARQEDAQAFKQGSVSPSALNTIARERQALAKAVADNEPSMLAKLFRRTNPRAGELETFDAALGAAQQILERFPDMDAEQGLAALGETDVTPNEAGQVQKFLLMLRGH